jgi:hypothetical protein
MSTTPNTAYTVGSSILWVYAFIYHNFPTLNNVEKIVWPTVYAILGVPSKKVTLYTTYQRKSYRTK